MGNFQELAEKVLEKYIYNPEKVSSFLTLVKETGNFSSKNGNCLRNVNTNIRNEKQYGIDSTVETNEETNRKLTLISEETFTLKDTPKSFVAGSKSSNIIEQFFSMESILGIELLPNDKRWIKAVIFDIHASKLTILLNEYIDKWRNAMELELLTHKKQNVGRRAANIWLRETLTNQHKQ